MLTFSKQKALESTLKKWFETLLFFNDTPENRDLMKDYFFRLFAENPQQFYQFLHYIKKQVSRIKNPAKRTIASSRYLSILSFLCERFGFYEEKLLLDDLCFKYCCSQDYQEISHVLSTVKKKSKSMMDSILKKLKSILLEKGYDCAVLGRYKSLYSIFKKLQKKQYQVGDLYDLFAFRIITPTNTIRECFEVLNILHDNFFPVAKHFKDYITIPKVNGYQSFHTGLKDIIPGYKKPIEVQIRTPEMNEFAEKGIAAHWIYSLHKKSFIPNEKERKLIEHFGSISKETKKNPFVHFLSYKGDVFMLKKGSTIIDFANRIHSNLAQKASSGLVNGIEKNLSYHIQDGDKIQILVKDYPRRLRPDYHYLPHETTPAIPHHR